MLKSKKIIVLISSILIISLLGVVGCSNQAGDSKVIKLATAAPMTGDYAQYGEYSKEGLELALEEINKNGGVLGKQIELVYGDDKGDPKEAVSVAQKFVNDRKIVAILGHFFSGATLAAGPIYEQNGIPALAIASTNPDVPKVGKYIFRINVGDNYQGMQLAKWLYEKKGIKKVAVVYDNNDYGKGVSNVFIKNFKQLGGEITTVESYIGGQEKDFSVIVTKIKESNAEAIMMASYPTEGALIAQQARNNGLDIPLICTDSIYTDDFIKLGGKAAEGAIVVSYFHPSDPRPEVQEFIKKFKEKYNKEPNSWSPYAYDAMYVMADAIKRAGSTDKKAIQKALAETKNFQGATGITTFNQDGEPEGKDLIILTVKNGAYVPLDE
ncbi:MAG: branched-chain amino acid transport system substrate-binding protein [Clostridiales bacterium]|jgi:branched-chain amino acid transport system substrate-binding protein|nr:branched-chain amino acid transport system substrate-binding protein [Clostridiales bacterium]MDK2933248.1 branched-chain amino acid transport system substrate-binding protein [Clostridiales bacterium]